MILWHVRVLVIQRPRKELKRNVSFVANTVADDLEYRQYRQISFCFEGKQSRIPRPSHTGRLTIDVPWVAGGDRLVQSFGINGFNIEDLGHVNVRSQLVQAALHLTVSIVVDAG